MIQRKQTLHLLIIAALLISMLFCDFATFTMEPTVQAETVSQQDGTISRTTVLSQDFISFKVWGLYNNGEKFADLIYFAILCIVAIAGTLVTIFLYKRLWVQVRFCLALGILLFGITAYIGMYVWKLKEMLPDYAVKYSVTDLFPILALIFLYMAYRGIARDIALLRSVDRIR